MMSVSINTIRRGVMGTAKRLKAPSNRRRRPWKLKRLKDFWRNKKLIEALNEYLYDVEGGCIHKV